jgi:hypothetical protein
MSERQFNILDELAMNARGKLNLAVVNRAGKRVDYREQVFGTPEFPHKNTVVKSAYQTFILLATGAVPTNAVKYFGLGDEPSPTFWDMRKTDCDVQWWTPTGRIVATPDIVGLTMEFVCEVGYDEGNGTGVHTYFEAVLAAEIWPGSDLFARVAFRDPDGAVAHVIKHDEYKLIFNWTIGWGVTS